MADRPNDRPAPRSAVGSVNGWLVAILLIAVAALYLQFTGAFPTALFNPHAQPRAIPPRGDPAEDEKTTIELFQQASPAVAHVTSSAIGRDRLTLKPLEIPRGTGSGFLWDEKGYIVTNYHVVQ